MIFFHNESTKLHRDPKIWPTASPISNWVPRNNTPSRNPPWRSSTTSKKTRLLFATKWPNCNNKYFLPGKRHQNSKLGRSKNYNDSSINWWPKHNETTNKNNASNKSYTLSKKDLTTSRVIFTGLRPRQLTKTERKRPPPPAKRNRPPLRCIFLTLRRRNRRTASLPPPLRLPKKFYNPHRLRKRQRLAPGHSRKGPPPSIADAFLGGYGGGGQT